MRRFVTWFSRSVLLCVFSVGSFAIADVIPANYILLAPPDFIGQPAAGTTPSRAWIYVGSYATQQDCGTAKGTMQYAFVEGGKVTRKPLPSVAACISATDYNKLN